MVYEFWTAMDGKLLGISKKNIFIFKTWQKMLTNLGPFSKLGKLSEICYHFLSSFENETIFFYPSLSPAHCRPEFIDQSILPTKIYVTVYFQKKRKKGQVFPGPFSTFQFCTFFCWKYTETSIFGQNWFVNELRAAMGGG